MEIHISRDSEDMPGLSVRSAVRMIGVGSTAKAFWNQMTGVCAKVALVRQCCGQVRESGRLASVVDHFLDMAKVLALPAERGLSPQALLALAETHPEDSDATVLQIFVDTAFQCGEESSLYFIRECPDLAAAAGLSADSIAREARSLRKMLARIEGERARAADARGRGVLWGASLDPDRFTWEWDPQPAPPLPPPETFLQAGEKVTLSGAVAKKGPSLLSPFRTRLLVLTGKRLVYFSSRPRDKTGVITLARGSVVGRTHGGRRFELTAHPGNTTLLGTRRYYFACRPAYQRYLPPGHADR